MSFKLKNGRYLGIRGSYQYSLKSASVGFNGKDDLDNPKSDSEELKADNVGFYVDGVTSKKDAV
ncbi:MAG: hypothetical protein IPJ54_11195 [Saprospiraceae bacterium]|nr:hypothetical protein [Saprospiraceae bacterium]